MSKIKIFCTLTSQNGKNVALEIPTEITPSQLRVEVSNATRIPLSQLRLIYRGKMIKDDNDSTTTSKTTNAVEAFKLEEDCVLHCMGKPATNEETTSAPVSSTTNTATTSNTTGSAPNLGTVNPSVPSVAESAPASTASTTTTTTPAPTTMDPLLSALQTLRSSNTPPVYKTAVTTLSKILNNIAAHPMEEKYRKVKQQNPAFQKRLGGLPGGDDAMKAVGFTVEQQDGVPVYQLHASPDAWPKLMAAKATMEQAVASAAVATTSLPAATSAAAATTTNAAAGTNLPFGGMPGMPANFPPTAAMNNPQMQAAMAEMMSNPEALRNMLQNPMLQQMIQNDPSVPPHLRASMQQLANNPAMLDQLSSMMSDPNTRARMQSMMGSNGGSLPAAAATMPGAGATTAFPPPAQQNNRSGNDQDQTEEDLIAEAIRRSLEDN